MSLFLSALGLVFIVEGLPYFCFPATIKSIAEKLTEVSNSRLRILGIGLMLAGLLIIYAAKR